jgi:hypothetical protein
MPVPVSKATLSPARRRLVELLQQLNFGRVEGLSVLDGDPVFDPPPRLVREVKFGGENGPRPEAAAADFPLKSQLVELFQHFDEIGDGTIDVLEVKHGLPFRMVVSEAAA